MPAWSQCFLQFQLREQLQRHLKEALANSWRVSYIYSQFLNRYGHLNISNKQPIGKDMSLPQVWALSAKKKQMLTLQ